VPTHSLNARAVILCLVLAVASAASLYAGGQKESPLDAARTLIANKDYTTALKQLAAIQRDQPELRDQVQALINEIYAIKDQYNAVLARLNAAKAAEDEEAMLKLVAEAQQIDPQASAGLGRGITVRVAVLNLMNQAADLLAAGRAKDALARYLLPMQNPRAAGVDLQKPEFDAAGYGALVTASVADSAARMLAGAQGEISGADQSAGVPAAVTALLGANLDASSPAAFDAAVAPLLRAATDQGRIRAAAAALSVLNTSIAEGKGASDPYLEYLGWLSTGRSKKTEGMAEAIRQVWEDRARTILDAAVARELKAYQAAVTRYRAGGLAEADGGFSDTRYAAIIAVKAAALVAAGLAPVTAGGGEAWQVASADADTALTLAADAQTAQAHAAEAEGYRALIAQRTSLDAMPAPVSLSQAQAVEARQGIAARLAEAAAAQEQWSERAVALGPVSAAGTVTADLSVSAQTVASAWSTLQQDLRVMDARLGARQASLEAAGFSATFDAAAAMRKKAQDLANATVNGDPSQDAPHKPSDALPLYSSAADTLASLTKTLADFRKRWQAEQPWVLRDPGFLALMSSTEALAAQMSAETSEVERLSAVAQTQRGNALGKRKEADAFFAAATRALDQKSYDTATANFRSASTSYLDSLQFEDDPTALERYTTDIPAALDKITAANRAQKLQDVDAQIASGRTQFNNEEFLKSFNTLQGALRSWRDLQGADEPYPALDALLEQVRGALDVSSGRDLDQSDSRAPAVNAFVSAANNLVTQATALARSSPQRALLLNDALVNVQRALAIVPVYRAAKALQLKVRKALAPTDAQFNAQADREIASIIDDLGRGTLTADRAYFQLKDYYDVRPDYPGLKDRLAKMEVSLGFTSTPVSAGDLAESDRQYRLASDSYRTGTPEALAAALKNLNTAIQLNPNNNLALALRRSILLRLGSPEVNALSATDLLLFNSARRYMGNNNYSDAYTILQDLVTRNGGRNKNYPPLAAAYLLARQQLGLP
jgi:hypothetical protein